MAIIEKLRYVRLGVSDPNAMSNFAERIVGLQPIEAPEGLKMFRSDKRDHSLVIYPSDRNEETLAVELRDADVLKEVTSKLTDAGYSLTAGTADELAARRCKAMSWFTIRDGVRIELVVRPQESGWRYFGARDAGITEFFGAAFASKDVEADARLWTEIFGGKISDYVGDAVYIALDDEHHRIAIHPSDRDGLLEMQFRIESLDQVMQNMYFLESAQVAIVHGPGRRPTSEQIFLTFKSPAPVLFGLVTEGARHPFDSDRLPRQFPATPLSYCGWGSESSIPEYAT